MLEGLALAAHRRIRRKLYIDRHTTFSLGWRLQNICHLLSSACMPCRFYLGDCVHISLVQTLIHLVRALEQVVHPKYSSRDACKLKHLVASPVCNSKEPHCTNINQFEMPA